MKIDSNWLQAIFPGEHRVFGKKLDPFCLFHAVTLEAIQSPILLDKEPTLVDLCIAVRICTSKREKVTDAIRYNWITRIWLIWVSIFYDFKKEFLKFKNYFQAYTIHPEVWASTSGKLLKAPWPLVNLVNLLKNTSLHPSEIWQMPLCELLWLSLAIAEQNGSSAEIVSEEEIAAIEAIKKIREQENGKN